MGGTNFGRSRQPQRTRRSPTSPITLSSPMPPQRGRVRQNPTSPMTTAPKALLPP